MILRRGDRGAEVRRLQAALGVAVDGIFGKDTDAAVRKFQEDQGLEVDGLAGPDTRAALRLIAVPDATCTPGDLPAVFTERVALARTWCEPGARRIKYGSGCGGYDPDGWPANDDDELDCSGLLARTAGLKRGPLAGGPPHWIESTQIYNDARGRQKRFRQIATPIPGCWAVYPDPPGGGQGHCGLVTSVENGVLRGIDCSSSRYKKTGQAVTERGFEFFRHAGAIFCLLVTDPDPVCATGK